MTTLLELYEETDAKKLAYRIIIAGADFTTRVNSFSYGFAPGEVPSATIVLSRDLLTASVAEEASVEIWLGFKLGLVEIQQLVFGGGVVNSVSRHGEEVQVECVQDGPRRLNYTWYRRIAYNFDNVTAQDSAVALLDLVGVTNYSVNLDPWDIGTAVPQTIEFSSYSEAVNKVSTVDGSPWYALPSGQVRVETRDPLPYSTPRRVYYSSILTGINEALPASGVLNAQARPRNLDVSINFDRAGVSNWIEVDGATLVTLGPNGEQNSEQITEFVDGAPGLFDNGAPWINTPPLFQQFTYNNELIDTNAKAFAVAERYYALKNRLMQNVSVTVPADPDVFLYETVRIIDDPTGINELYCVVGYRTSISSSEATTELTLVGGHYSGNQGFATPFAEFIWTHQAFYQQFGGDSNNQLGGTACSDSMAALNEGWQTGLGAKLCQDLPANTGDANKGGNKADITATVYIGLDGTPSQDFDGQIVDWAWSDDQGHTGNGPRITFIYDPQVASSVQVTLTVTDDTARTDSITKTIYLKADYTTPNDPSLNDTAQGGGAAAGDCTQGGDPGKGGTGLGGSDGMALVYFVAADCKAMATKDNTTWNMFDKSDVGVGDFKSVAAKSDFTTGETIGLYGTDNGQIVKTTDGAISGSVVHSTGVSETITSITFDPKNCSRAIAFTSRGAIMVSDDNGDTWKQTRPGDNIPINKAMFIDGLLYAFGGDTSNPDTLIRVSNDQGVTFTPVPIIGALRAAILAAGPGGSITSAARNEQGLSIGFAGVSGLVWNTTDLQKQNWAVASGITGTRANAIAPGFGADAVVATDDGTFNTTDNQNYTPACGTATNDVSWEGLPGVYMSVTDGAINKNIDDTCGAMMPSAKPGQTALPPCAIPRKVAVAQVPRDPDLCGHWPGGVTDPGTLGIALREALGTGGGSIGRSYTIPDLGGARVLLIRYQTDANGIFNAVDELAWTPVGQGTEWRVDYCVVAAIGQVINWTMSGAGAINYAVNQITPSTTFVEVTGVNFQQFTNVTSASTTLSNTSDYVISDRGIGFSNIPVTLPTMQSPLSPLTSETGARPGGGACDWAGGSSPGVFYIANIGIRTRQEGLLLHHVEGAFAQGYGSNPFLNGGPFSVLPPASYDRVILLSLTNSDPPTNNLTWHQYNAGPGVVVYYAYLPSGQHMDNIIVNNISPPGEVGNPVAVYLKPDIAQVIRGRVDYKKTTQHTAVYLYNVSTVPTVNEACGGNYELVVSGPDPGPPTGGFDFIIPSHP